MTGWTNSTLGTFDGALAMRPRFLGRAARRQWPCLDKHSSTATHCRQKLRELAQQQRHGSGAAERRLAPVAAQGPSSSSSASAGAPQPSFADVMANLIAALAQQAQQAQATAGAHLSVEGLTFQPPGAPVPRRCWTHKPALACVRTSRD